MLKITSGAPSLTSEKIRYPKSRFLSIFPRTPTIIRTRIDLLFFLSSLLAYFYFVKALINDVKNKKLSKLHKIFSSYYELGVITINVSATGVGFDL